MYAVIRRYTGAAPLIEAMERRRGEVQQVIGSVPGFVRYDAARAGDELTTVTICLDETGLEESTRRAGKWVRDNVGTGVIGTPEVYVGEVFVSFTDAGAPSLGATPDGTRSPA